MNNLVSLSNQELKTIKGGMILLPMPTWNPNIAITVANFVINHWR